MEKPKLRLKEQPPSSSASRDWLHTRYAQPKPPSALERFVAAIKRLGRLTILAVVVVSVFLVIPFRRWDDYAIWQQVQEALIQLERQPDSLPLFQRFWATAKVANILWTEPSGARPEKWCQSVQRKQYDACYGVIQVLALGIIKNGNVSQGVGELDRLQQRTGLSSLPNLPCKDQVIRICTKCKNGKIEEICPACKGQGTVSVPASKSSFPLNASLGGTRQPSKRLGSETPVRQNCPKCQATGKCTIKCPTCSGHVTDINFAAYPDVFQSTVRGTITAIAETMRLRRITHILANAQGLLLLRSREVGNNILSAAHGDMVFNSTNSTASLLNPSQVNESAAFHGVAAQDSLEARLQKACGTLQHTPLSVPDLQILADVARSATNNPALRSCAMAAFGLSCLLQGNTNAFTRVAQIQKTAYPDLPPLLTITEGDYTATCDGCLGACKKDMPCPSCMGPGKCKVCNGAGRTAAGDGFVPCEACGHQETCRMCKGQKRMAATCPVCRGTGKTFKLNDNVRKNYNALLTNIVTMCRENLAEQLNEAKLDQTENMGAPKPTQCGEISRHPETSSQTKLQLLRERSTVKQGREQLIRKVLTGILFLIVGLLFVHRLLRKKQAHGLNALPGMDKIDSRELTDPLTLAAQESKARAKTKTARIPSVND
ncbi:MAG: hypothetical protein PHV28_11890 [Kiritimatiellae bacterium]|nr:hypothetical protein [Kiritimatiellia bacterium]